MKYLAHESFACSCSRSRAWTCFYLPVSTCHRILSARPPTEVRTSSCLRAAACPYRSNKLSESVPFELARSSDLVLGCDVHSVLKAFDLQEWKSLGMLQHLVALSVLHGQHEGGYRQIYSFEHFGCLAVRFHVVRISKMFFAKPLWLFLWMLRCAGVVRQHAWPAMTQAWTMSSGSKSMALCRPQAKFRKLWENVVVPTAR